MQRGRSIRAGADGRRGQGGPPTARSKNKKPRLGASAPSRRGAEGRESNPMPPQPSLLLLLPLVQLLQRYNGSLGSSRAPASTRRSEWAARVWVSSK